MQAQFDAIPSAAAPADFAAEQERHDEEDAPQPDSRKAKWRNPLIQRIAADCLDAKKKTINCEAALAAWFYFSKKTLDEFNGMPAIKNAHGFFRQLCVRFSNLYAAHGKISEADLVAAVDQIARSDPSADAKSFVAELTREINYQKPFAKFGAPDIRKTVIKLHDAINLFETAKAYLRHHYASETTDAQIADQHLRAISKMRGENKAFFEKIMNPGK